MTRRTTCALAAVVAVSMVAVSAALGTAAPPLRVVLADYSLDTTQAQQAEAIRIVKVVADLAADDEGFVAAATFQANALSSVTWPILHRFQPSEAAPNSYYAKLDLKRQAEDVKKQADGLFASQDPVEGTDLIGGFLAAAELLEAQPAGPRALIVVSNMWAYNKADGLNLKRRALNATEIERLIKRLYRAKKIADLTDVSVCIIGGGLDPKRLIPNAIQVSLRAFWDAYIRRSGGTLRAWTPTLQTDPTC